PGRRSRSDSATGPKDSPALLCCHSRDRPKAGRDSAPGPAMSSTSCSRGPSRTLPPLLSPHAPRLRPRPRVAERGSRRLCCTLLAPTLLGSARGGHELRREISRSRGRAQSQEHARPEVDPRDEPAQHEAEHRRRCEERHGEGRKKHTKEYQGTDEKLHAL